MMEMKDMIFCQSCGMPLQSPESHGSEADGSQSADYCNYCYQKGAFTWADASMDEMIEQCVPPMVEANKDMSEEQARAMMRQFFPQLKRWRQ